MLNFTIFLYKINNLNRPFSKTKTKKTNYHFVTKHITVEQLYVNIILLLHCFCVKKLLIPSFHACPHGNFERPSSARAKIAYYTMLAPCIYIIFSILICDNVTLIWPIGSNEIKQYPDKLYHQFFLVINKMNDEHGTHFFLNSN